MSNEPNKVIYSMLGASKYYDKEPVLKDIYLSYFYGAKIGVIGLNGSGKSSLAETAAWLEHHLQTYPGTIIAVTHDRYFLENVAKERSGFRNQHIIVKR
jgi:ATPase subunit of ABC transporter with duplicated ATPase domains